MTTPPSTIFLRKRSTEQVKHSVIISSLLAVALPCSASIILTTDGGVLHAERYEVDGKWARVYLEGQGMLMMPLLKIERIIDDEEIPGLEIDQLAAAQLELGFSEGDPPPDTPFGDLIFAAARRHRVNPAIVAALIQAESDFDPEALSPKGARGLMQLMPATADRFGVQSDQLFEVEKNLEAGVRYFSLLMNRFPNDLLRILAAYNAGEATVDRYHGVPPYRETRDYIRRIFKTLGLAL